MNETPDGLNTHTPDPALEAELRAYFASRQSAPPNADAFWLRLAPHLELRSTPTLAPERPAQPQPQLQDRYLDHLDGDEQPLPAIVSGNGNGGQPRRGRRFISTLGSLAAVVLICLAAVVIFSQFGHGTSVEHPNGKIVKSRLLTWRQITLPPGVVLQDGEGVVVTRDGGTPVMSPPTLQRNATYIVASNNGNVAYICETPARATPRIWVTVSAGQRWTRLPDPPTSTTDFTGCDMWTDKNDARTLVLSFANHNSAPDAVNTWVFFDGASQWQPVSQPAGPEFASSHGAYFSIRGAPYQSAVKARLYISTDQMRSWREIDAPLIAENDAAVKRLKQKQTGATGVEHIWAHPATGELLAQTYDGMLWLSDDSGTTWSQVALPQVPPSSGASTPPPGEVPNETSQAGAAWVYVQQPVGNEAFTLCALVFDPSQSQNMIILNNVPLFCSSDSGKRWLQAPRLTVAVGNGKPDQFELPMAMLSNGALITWDVRTISMMAGAAPELLTGHILGAIPPPFDPNNIPGGSFGVTQDGAVFWYPQDIQTLYVAVYTYSSDLALSA